MDIDLIIIGFGRPPTDIDPYDALRLIKPFKRLTYATPLLQDGRRYDGFSMMTLLVDDPEFVSNDLHVLFLRTPTERKSKTNDELVRVLERSLTAWFGGFLIEVYHYPDQTLCTICKRVASEEDDEVPFEIVGVVWDQVEPEQLDRIRRGETVSDLSGSDTATDGSDHPVSH